MSQLVNYFTTQFVPLCSEESEDLNDPNSLVILINFFEYAAPSTPIQLKYDIESLKIMPECILNNFGRKYENTMYPKFGIRSMYEIIKAKDGSDTSNARLILLLHASKADLDVTNSANFFTDIEHLVVKNEEDYLPEEKEWIKLAHKVVKHAEINEVVGGLSADYTEKPNIPQNCSIRIISNIVGRLKGFAGIHTLYINSQPFIDQRKTLEINKRDPISITMEIVTVTVHEFGHSQLRMLHNDFNISSPKLAIQKHLSDNHHEFVELVELEIFGKLIDWTNSPKIQLSYMLEFITAIHTGTSLPDNKGIPLAFARVKERCVRMAAYYELDKNYF